MNDEIRTDAPRREGSPSASHAVVLYDDSQARRFQPFATTRPLGEMRAGALLVRERWGYILETTALSFVSAPLHRGFEEFDAPPFCADSVLPVGTVLVNTRALPFLASVVRPTHGAWVIGDRVASLTLREPLSVSSLVSGTLTLDELAGDAPRHTVDGVWLDEVWDIIRHLNVLLGKDIPALAARYQCTALDDDGGSARGPVVTGGHPVWMEAGAVVEPFSTFDTTLGPILLRRGASVQAYTRVAGPCYVGRDSSITTDRISGSSIGDTCRVHGELSATVFIGHANKGHDGFVGHSIIGRWVNLGAGTITSNLKNTYGTVALWTPEGIRDTGLQFLGTLFGDHAKTGIGMRLTTGCVVGAGANVFGAMPPKAVAPFSWGDRAPYDRFALDKFLQIADRMMSRRAVTLSGAQRRHLENAYTLSVGDAAPLSAT